MEDLKQYDEAIQTLDQVLETQQNAFTLRTKGGAMLSQKRYKEAIQILDQALAIKPRNVHTLDFICSIA